MSISDRIKIVDNNATDNPIKLDGKLYLVESVGWNMISLINEGRISQLLDYIRDNFTDKDNPVPSLDKVQPSQLKIAEFPSNWTIQDVLDRYDWKLQNGVETNKEQPKKFKCRRGYDGCDHYEGDDICNCN